DLFDARTRRAFLGPMGFLFLRVAVLVEVHHAAHRRLGGGRYFDQVEPAALGQRQRFTGAHYSRLMAVGINHSYLGRANQLINSKRRFAHWWKTIIPRDKTPPLTGVRDAKTTTSIYCCDPKNLKRTQPGARSPCYMKYRQADKIRDRRS